MSDFYSQHFEVSGFIREVFGYMDRFKGQLFVLKIEDGLMDHPLFPVLMRDIALLHKAGIRIIIVPGTRNSIDAQLKAWEIESKFEGGVRLTSEEALPLIEQASLGVAQRIMSHLTASGLSGIQGNWVLARSLGVIEGVDYMRTGRIERIQRDILEQLLNERFVPIIPPIGWNKLGQAYNISSTELATELCKYMQVGKLFFIGSENGIKLDGLATGKNTNYLEPTDSGVISALDVDQAKELLELNAEKLNFAQKDYLQNAINACEAGANRVHLLSGEFQGSVLQEVFSARGDGTMVYANQYSSIRPANMEGLRGVQHRQQHSWLRRTPRIRGRHGRGGRYRCGRQLPQVRYRRRHCTALDFCGPYEGLQEAVLADHSGPRLVLSLRIRGWLR